MQFTTTEQEHKLFDLYGDREMLTPDRITELMAPIAKGETDFTKVVNHISPRRSHLNLF